MAKICFIAWERFGYGGVSRTISNLVNSLSQNFYYDISILCLKQQKYFQNIYKIDTRKVKFTYLELSLIQKIRRDIFGYIFSKFPIFTSHFMVKLYPKLRYPRSYLLKIINYINQNEFDIVIFSSGFEDCLQLAIIKHQLHSNINLIAWSHASFLNYFEGKGRMLSINQQAVWKHYYKNFDKIVVLSDADVFACKKYLDLDSIRIYNSISLSPQKLTSLENRKFIFVGALSKCKGADILIDGFINFARKEATWSLDIYGEGPIEEYIRHQINLHSLEDRVLLYGNTSDVVDKYSEASILLFCSRYDGFGIVQAEAMCCGLPIIAARIPITEELIEKHQVGELFEWANPISMAEIMLSFIDKDISIYSRNGIKLSKQFTIEQISSDWNLLFRTLMSL